MHTHTHARTHLTYTHVPVHVEHLEGCVPPVSLTHDQLLLHVVGKSHEQCIVTYHIVVAMESCVARVMLGYLALLDLMVHLVNK